MSPGRFNLLVVGRERDPTGSDWEGEEEAKMSEEGDSEGM
jgi:hypothetical protein